MPIRWLRRLHRYLGLIIGIQLLLWTLSGLYFTWNDIGAVRGEDDIAGDSAPIQADADLPSLNPILSDLRTKHGESVSVEYITLRTLLGRPTYEIAFRLDSRDRFALADAVEGKLRSPLTRDEAVAVAMADFLPEASVKLVELINQVSGDSEYRGRDLPAYRVSFDHHTGTRIYVSKERGVVTARRNNVWRAFDFLWMMHIMDYEGRDDINTVLLRILSAFGVLTVLSGYGLWVTGKLLYRKKRSSRRLSEPDFACEADEDTDMRPSLH